MFIIKIEDGKEVPWSFMATTNTLNIADLSKFCNVISVSVVLICCGRTDENLNYILKMSTV